MNTLDAKGLMKELRVYFRYEQIAVKLNVSFNTVYAWARGYKKCSIANFAMLQQLLDEQKKVQK